MFRSIHLSSEKRSELRDLEAQVSRLRLRQAVIVNDLDKINIAAGDGHRSMHEWVGAEIDVSRQAASELVTAARLLRRNRGINYRLDEGHITFDRGLALLRLTDAGADAATLAHAETCDLAGVARLTARQRRITHVDEQTAFAERYVAIQPTLDESSWRLTGQLPAVEGSIVEQALHLRADELRALPEGDTCTRGQRQADSLVAMAMDSLNHTSNGEDARGGGSVSILVDLGEANGTGGESGVGIEYGPRVGPAMLEELLCTGSVQVIGLENGTPVVTSQATRAIPTAVRRLVANRDGGCTIAGCTSRYRLEPHHIVHRADGGTHDPENLTTLCWLHHHVAIHRQGLGIDPDSPPLRRRLVRSRTGHDPPL
jgi:hypothetical protein